MNKYFLPLLLAFASPWFALADDAAIRPDIDELFTAMRMEKIMHDSMDQAMKMIPKMTESMTSQSLSKLSPAEAEKVRARAEKMQEKTMALVEEEMSWEKIKGPMAQVYAESLTPEEVKGITAFYKSPAGQAFLDKQPVIMQKTMAMTQKLMMDLMPKMQALIQNEIAETTKEDAATPADTSPKPAQ